MQLDKVNRMSSESLQTRLNGRVAIEIDNVNRIFLRQLWQGLPFLPQISYMRRMLLRRKSSYLLKRCGNRRTFASAIKN